MEEKEIILSLHQLGKVYYNIELGDWEDNQEYLSRNIDRKIKAIKRYKDRSAGNLPNWIERTLDKNLNDLRAHRVLPALPDTSIEIQMMCLAALDFDVDTLSEDEKNYLSQNILEVGMGSSWLDTKYYEAFLEDLLKTKVSVSYINNAFSIKLERNTYASRELYGTSKFQGEEIVEAVLNLRQLKVYATIKKGSGEKKVLDVEATQEAQLKMGEVRQKWQEWLWSEEERTVEIVKEYNSIFNSYQVANWNGSHLTLPGCNPQANLTPPQKDDVFRLLRSKNFGLFAEVGFGKTWVMVCGAMELQRLKLAKRIIISVLNSTLEQFVREIKFLYPNARILYKLESKNSKISIKEQRAILYSQINQNQWDIVLLTHEQLNDIPLSTETQGKILEQKIREAEINLKQIESSKEKFDYQNIKRFKKELVNTIAKSKEELVKLYQNNRQPFYITWEDLEIDCLMVDESQQFKNLGFFTLQKNIAGVSNRNSLRAQNLHYKVQYLQSEGKRVVFATGTPVSNSIGEIYTLLRYLAPELLMDMGLETFDRWVAQFGEIEEKPEVTVTGSYKIKSRFSYFKNLPELMAIIRRFASIRTANSNAFLEKPNPHYHTERIKLTATQQNYMEELAERAELVMANKVQRTVDNMAKISAQARLNTITPNLVRYIETDPQNKLNAIIRNVFLVYELTNPVRGVQVIFCDLVNYIYETIQRELIKLGVPKHEVRAVQDAKNREELYAAAREGKARIILASTAIAGTGVNIQDRLAVLHHLDAPWRPADVIQREGRIVRQKNQFKDVIILRYINESSQGRMSYDTYAWQTLENKAQFYEQVWTSKKLLPRKIEDIYCERSLSYSQVKAIASGNSLLISQTELINAIKNLEIEQSIFRKKLFQLSNDKKIAPIQITHWNKMISSAESGTFVGTFGEIRVKNYEQFYDLLKEAKIHFVYDKIGTIHGAEIDTKLTTNKDNKITLSYVLNSKKIPMESVEEFAKYCKMHRDKQLEKYKEKLEYYTRVLNSDESVEFPKLGELHEKREQLKIVQIKINEAILKEANTNLSEEEKEEEEGETVNEENLNAGDCNTGITPKIEESIFERTYIKKECTEILKQIEGGHYPSTFEWLSLLKDMVNECNLERNKSNIIEEITIKEVTPKIYGEIKEYRAENNGQLCLFK